jgi:drug/metabolite transporter (DMT)-like permease
MLGAFLAFLSAASFAATNAAGRRGVVTGTPAQGMVLSNPIGLLFFLVVAVLTAEIARIGQLPAATTMSMAGVGVLHFVVGRYANLRANQSAGANLTAPVIQLNVVVTLILAVLVLGEPCTVLQLIGGCIMLSGTFIARRQTSANLPAVAPKFAPRRIEGLLFALLAALAYGTSPIMTRTALQFSGAYSAILGGVIAYGSAAAVVAIMMLFSTSLRRNVMSLRRDNVRWFLFSGVAVAVAQAFLYAALAVAPIMVVIPLLQLSLVLQLSLSMWLSPEHEVFGPKVIFGAVVSLVGVCAVAVDSDLILAALGVPDTAARFLRWQTI